MHYSRAMDTVSDAGTLSLQDQLYADRAAAHAAHDLALRPAQRFDGGVDDLGVARIMLAIERGNPPRRAANGRWWLPAWSKRETALRRAGDPAVTCTTAVHEMIRTGLVRDWRDKNGEHHLIPAKTHLIARTGTLRHSACRFVGEDMGPMRARLVGRIELVDCLECEAVDLRARRVAATTTPLP